MESALLEPSAPVKEKWLNRPKFTSESAREARKKGIADARERKTRELEIKRQVALEPKALASLRAEMLSKEITHTCDVLATNLEPKERAQLLTALSRLIDQERVLRGIPNPGSYRPSKPRTDAATGDATPL